MVQAMRHLEEVVRLDPNDGLSWQFLGHLYKDLGNDRARAITCYREALRCGPGPADGEEVRKDLAELLVKMNNYGEAREVLDGCDPRATRVNPALLALQAECLWGQDQGAEAKALLDQALADHPCSVELLRVGARTHLAAREFQAAASLLERTLALDRHDYTSRYQLGQAYEALGRRADAAAQRRLAEQTRQQMEDLTRLNQEATTRPWDKDLRLRLAELCDQLDKPELAAMWRQAAATCPPATN